MTKERSQEIEFVRSEIVGPSRPLNDLNGKDQVKPDAQGRFVYPDDLPGKGMPIFWSAGDSMPFQEIIHFRHETPLNRYGTGMLFPAGLREQAVESVELEPEEKILDEGSVDEALEEGILSVSQEDEQEPYAGSVAGEQVTAEGYETDNDFDVTSPDIFRPSTMGISFCLAGNEGTLEISLPAFRRFFWQDGEDDESIQINGRYIKGEKTISTDGNTSKYPAWLRVPATSESSKVKIEISKLKPGVKESESVPLPEGSSLALAVEVFPRKFEGHWIITVVLRNVRSADRLGTKEGQITNTLFQSFFEVRTKGVSFARYPEGVRPFDQFDEDEQTLALLYQDAATWAIGHGCAAGWDVELDEKPSCLYADVMPAVELPSMTPDITDAEGNPVKMSMRELADLPAYDATNSAWQSLENLLRLYGEWIFDQRKRIDGLEGPLQLVAERHMSGCQQCFDRMERGLELLKSDSNDAKARCAFRLANKCMLLQQVATKQLKKRLLRWNGQWVAPAEPENPGLRSPTDIYPDKVKEGIGYWRAFQIAFVLMSLDGLVNDIDSNDRDIVDLIWFPTGGGKTEAYLGVAAFYLFHQRLLMSPKDSLSRDGTGVFMRYTLRMLTTQQFQRAASLICAMENVRQVEFEQGKRDLGETRFSLGLWIGGDGSPNKCDDARTRLNKFRNGKSSGNPLVLTECPWCRSEIGRLTDDPRKKQKGAQKWADVCSAGLSINTNNEPVLKCSDDDCDFGGEYNTLPIEVIDERIYKNPPSIFIGTADKFAMLSYKPEAGALFGRKHGRNGGVEQTKRPPGLIIQDEYHLISGPLGTMYGVYEGLIERLCSVDLSNGEIIKPKIIASTATIRGAQDQVQSVYARDKLQLFPNPGLLMKDSFFGCYAKKKDGRSLESGRLYFGIHANGYGSFLTTQVRLFTALLFRAWFFDGEKKDAWWTLLAFYNSLRELGGARTLFDSDIASRLKNYFFRYGCDKNDTRYLNKVVELTSRKSQSELVELMDRLSEEWGEDNRNILDACLASNIIEVGVDIDRLSLMAVVGQPKSTAQYIQVTGRVGRRWWERPGLILSMYNPAKSRDRSHFEQFHSYHRRLYERVEPTSATPFSMEAIERAMVGALILWARQFYDAEAPGGRLGDYEEHLKIARNILIDRCKYVVEESLEQQRVINAIGEVYKRLLNKWERNPQKWQEFPQKNDGEYLMLWPGQFATEAQRRKGEITPSSMRNVDASAYMNITDLYLQD